jgi:dTDP-4-dehydrorhamnose reductase
MNVLIIGADGQIGESLLQFFKSNSYRVAGTSRRKETNHYYWDMENSFKGQIPLIEFDLIYICAAITNIKYCRENPENARRINVKSIVELLEKLNQNNKHIVFLSSSAVFDCKEPNMRENREYLPATEYGRLKVELELIVRERSDSSILRMTKVLSSNFQLFKNWKLDLLAGKKITAFTDLSMSPILINDVVEVLFNIGVGKRPDIYQISGLSDISYYNAAKYLAKKINVSESLVMPSSAQLFGIPAEEILMYTSLNSEKVEKLYDYKFRNPYQVLDLAFKN